MTGRRDNDFLRTYELSPRRISETPKWDNFERHYINACASADYALIISSYISYTEIYDLLEKHSTIKGEFV